MSDTALRLGIDFGTSSTVAFLARHDGRVAPLLFGDTPVLPSAVCLDPDGGLLVGRDATYAGRSRPEDLEPNPKRRIDEGTVLLGSRELPVVDLITAVLRRVGQEAVRVTGEQPTTTVLSCPAGWGARRRGVLRAAADAAGLVGVSLVAEPVAAAWYFVKVLGNDLPPDSCLVVYDFGAGTFDVSVVRRTRDGFTVLAEEGLPDAGGLDVDAAIVGYLGAVYAGRDPQRWHELLQPATPAQRRANRQLWDDVRMSKELLSRATSTTVHVPLLDVDTPLGREQLELLARPVLDRTIAATRSAILTAGQSTGRLAGVFLVGGSSRIPLVATLLHRAVGNPPVAIEQPELVVGEGCLHAPLDEGPAADVPTPTSLPATPFTPAGPPAPPPRVRAVASVPVGPPLPPPEPRQPEPRQPEPPRADPPRAEPPRAEPPAPGSGPPAEDSWPESDEPASTAPTAPPTAPTGAGRQRRIALVAGAAVVILAIAGILYAVLRPDGDDQKTGGADGDCARSIAFVGPRTGNSKPATDPIKANVQWAIDEHNAANADRSVCLVEVDTAAENADKAVAAMHADPSVLAVVGPLLNGEVEQYGEAFEMAGLPYITPTAGGVAVNTGRWATFHRLAALDPNLAAAASRWARDDLGGLTVFIVKEPDDYGTSMAAAFAGADAATVVGTATIKSGETDVAAVVGQVSASGAGMVYYAGTIVSATPLIEALRTAGFTGPVAASEQLFDDLGVAGTLGAAAAPVYITCSCAPSDAYFTGPAEALTKALRDRYNTGPSAYGPAAYDTTRFLLAGIDQGRTTRAALQDYLTSGSYQGFPEAVYRFVAGGERPADDLVVGVYKLEATGLFRFEKTT